MAQKNKGVSLVFGTANDVKFYTGKEGRFKLDGNAAAARGKVVQLCLDFAVWHLFLVFSEELDEHDGSFVLDQVRDHLCVLSNNALPDFIQETTSV